MGGHVGEGGWRRRWRCRGWRRRGERARRVRQHRGWQSSGGGRWRRQVGAGRSGRWRWWRSSGGPAPLPSSWVKDRLAVIHTPLPLNLVRGCCDPSTAALTAAQLFTCQPPFHVACQGGARPSPFGTCTWQPRPQHQLWLTGAGHAGDGAKPEQLAPAHILQGRVQTQPLEQLIVGDALAPLKPLGRAAHASHTAAMEDADTIAHVLVERQDFTAKEEDGEDEGFVHQCFHTWRHIPGGKDGLGEAIKGGGGKADATAELGSVRQSRAED